MSNRIVQLPPIESFGHLTPDKWLLLKTLEEAAEMVEAGKRLVKGDSTARRDLIAEWADVLQTLANVASAFGITDEELAQAMDDCLVSKSGTRPTMSIISSKAEHVYKGNALLQEAFKPAIDKHDRQVAERAFELGCVAVDAEEHGVGCRFTVGQLEELSRDYGRDAYSVNNPYGRGES